MQSVEGLEQILPDGLFHEQLPADSGENPSRPYGAPCRGQGAVLAEEPQGGGLPVPLPPSRALRFPLSDGHMEAPDDIRALFLVFEPHVLRRQHHLAAGGISSGGRGRSGVIVATPSGRLCPPHRHRAGGIALPPGPDPHGGGHGQKHPVPSCAANAPLTPVRRYTATVRRPSPPHGLPAAEPLPADAPSEGRWSPAPG